jgi:hypothetical protein
MSKPFLFCFCIFGLAAQRGASTRGHARQLWTHDRFVSTTWSTGFPIGVGPEASRALSAGEPVRVRVDVTIFESVSADPWSSEPGDSRVVWQGRLETARP